MSKAGRLIVIEGPDGVGKTTLATRVVERLAAQGVLARYVSFPGRESGTLGHFVYRVHHDSQEALGGTVSPAALQTLHVAAHIDVIHTSILPALQTGESVVLDRYWWSTWVYGVANGIPRALLDAIIQLEREAWRDIRPTIALLISRDQPWRLEGSAERWNSLVTLYQEIAEREAASYPVERITNDRPVQNVVEELIAILNRIALEEMRNPSRPFDRRDDRGHERTTESSEQMNLQIAEHPHETTTRRIHKPSTFTPAKPTPVFDTYWRFATERQAIFFRRLHGQPAPWTRDPILNRHKFTNAYRASDRVSQFVIRSIIYTGDQAPKEIFFRVLLFKLFNRIETWNLLEREVGPLSCADFSSQRYGDVLANALERGERIYSAAYIMPAADRHPTKKHVGHLHLLERMLRDELPKRLQEARSLRQAFETLRMYPMMGDFLAYQYIIDLNYSPVLNFSEMEFVLPGPGARRGIRKCFSDLGGLSEADLIRLVTERQDRELADRGLKFQDLWGRPLQLVDCQNLFCEVDKYSRVAHPEYSDGTGRARIKQRFTPTATTPACPWYPPKWGLNARIAAEAEVDDEHVQSPHSG